MKKSFKNVLVDSMHWWLGKKKPFVINDEYRLELLFIDKINNSAKIQITNIKDKTTETLTVREESNDEQ